METVNPIRTYNHNSVRHQTLMSFVRKDRDISPLFRLAPLAGNNRTNESAPKPLSCQIARHFPLRG